MHYWQDPVLDTPTDGRRDLDIPFAVGPGHAGVSRPNSYESRELGNREILHSVEIILWARIVLAHAALGCCV
jgi:hypothetical protein